MANSYKKMYGWVNIAQAPPHAEAGGKFWITKNGVIAVFPDHRAEEGIEAGLSFEPLPEGTECITQEGLRLIA